MRVWRGMGLICLLALGCGGALSNEGMQEDERSQLSAPTGLPESGLLESGIQDEMAPEQAQPALGTAHLVKDLFPPISGPPWWGPFPESLVAFQGKLFFAANFEDGRRELWKSDGTSGGTVPVKQFSSPPSGFFFNTLNELTPLGSRLFFVVSDADHGRELWVSDGTTGGTRLVKDIVPGPGDSGPYHLKAVGSWLLFFRYIPETPTSPSRTELWRSDGTEAGTVRIKDLGADTSLSFVDVVVNNTLFFVFTDPAHGTELWKSNGTEAGTGLVKDILPGPDSSYPYGLRALGHNVYFTATDLAHGTELWRSDGTLSGTVLAADLKPGPDSNYVQVLDAVLDYLYFAVRDQPDGSMTLYRLRNGAPASHVKFVAHLPNPYSDPDSSLYIDTFAVAGERLFFSLGIYGFGPAPRDTQLWASNGTTAGTTMVHHPLSLYDEFGTTLFALDKRVLFSGADDTSGLELWVSKGTLSNTRRVQDISPGPASSFPQGFTRVGSQVFFVAHDGVHGSELWVLPLRY
ncbi:MAG: ELWxxDGT repeat protein [Hyalangium sp.]|uniref:ELWxxDGT repeat protein n=1 Tax=Hyalangium sp. TaxID=2028555 RepID=UPI00389B17BB